MPNVFLAVPHYHTIHAGALPGLFAASRQGACAALNMEGGSLLSLVFNRLWCRALNTRQRDSLTHFAMHHSDIQAPCGWLDVLLEEMERHQADVLSAVVAIKDFRGLTSTGYRRDLGPITRLTVKEVNALPETFSIARVMGRDGNPLCDHHLMINTGLWVCRFTEQWVEEVCFNVADGNFRESDGTFRPRCLPEDWNFSGFCGNKGLKVMATRKLRVVHHGDGGYPNDGDWGAWDTDLGD